MTRISPRIFIVEDEALIAMELRDRLTGLGYTICGHAARGEFAVGQIAAARPDLVLMDINLAGPMNGIEVAERLHAESDTPVIFLSAYSDSELVGRAVKTGPLAYLVKPFEERELRANIETALYKHSMERQLHEANRLLDRRATELGETNRQLRESLAKVKQLSGLLPICMCCKKIRDDRDYWHSVESYISEHTEAKLTHGFCPQCFEDQMKRLDDIVPPAKS